jgi:hypothetical protein
MGALRQKRAGKERMTGESVFLEWTTTVPLMQQSALIAALRGPDSPAPFAKEATRWLRSVTQRDADPSHTYMRHSGMPSIDALAVELEYLSVHYATHLLQAFEIVGYKHPDAIIAQAASRQYTALARQIFHLEPETEAQLDERL